MLMIDVIDAINDEIRKNRDTIDSYSITVDVNGDTAIRLTTYNGRFEQYHKFTGLQLKDLVFPTDYVRRTIQDMISKLRDIRRYYE